MLSPVYEVLVYSTSGIYVRDFGYYVEGTSDEYGGAKPDWAAKIRPPYRCPHFKDYLVDRGVDWNSVRAVATNRSRWRTHCPVKDLRI